MFLFARSRRLAAAQLVLCLLLAQILPSLVLAQAPEENGLVRPGLSPAARDLPLLIHPLDQPVREVNPRQFPPHTPTGADAAPRIVDPLWDETGGARAFSSSSPLLSFDGIPNVDGTVPPDPVGDVGPNHYVQMVNVSFAIFDKNGSQLLSPRDISQLWNGQGNACESSGGGDPIVLYDPLADRWLLSQFAAPNGHNNPPWYQCIAISTTPDPTGSYYLYAFQISDYFPDYPKFGVWPDAYYMAANENDVGIYAFQRSRMLSGQAASFQKKQVNNRNFMLPADLDGSRPPPAGAPGHFYTFVDSSYWGGASDRLEIWEFVVDWDTPANSSFTHQANLIISPFNYTVCGYFIQSCIPQPSPGEKLDPISEWPMWRAQYRNFGAHQILVGNFTVDVDGSQHAGIRWFELRRTDSTGWSLHQEGSYAPDAHHRWVGSIAMDSDGNIALGYSVASSSLKPAIRYTSRAASDPAGTLGGERSLIEGGGVQTNGSHRWGDYSSLNVDPSDDCTFWYTNQYYAATSGAGWRTRVGTFQVASCGNPLLVTKTVDDDQPRPGQLITYTVTVNNRGTSPVTGAFASDTLASQLSYLGPVSLDPPGAGLAGDPPRLVSQLAVSAGQTVTIRYPVQVKSGTAAGTRITNTVAVSASEFSRPASAVRVITVYSEPPAQEERYLPLIFKNE